MLVLVLGFVGLLASVTFFVRDPLPMLSPRVPVAFAPENGIAVRLSVDGGFAFEALVESTETAETPPRLVLRPVGTGGAGIMPDAARLDEGLFLASGQFNAVGRWELGVRHGDTSATFVFILRE